MKKLITIFVLCVLTSSISSGEARHVFPGKTYRIPRCFGELIELLGGREAHRVHVFSPDTSRFNLFTYSSGLPNTTENFYRHNLKGRWVKLTLASKHPVPGNTKIKLQDEFSNTKYTVFADAQNHIEGYLVSVRKIGSREYGFLLDTEDGHKEFTFQDLGDDIVLLIETEKFVF